MLERAGVELRIPQGLPDQFSTTVGEPAEPAAVVLLRGRLFADRLAVLGRVELVGGKLLQFLVPGEQFHLAVADLCRLLFPAGDLVVDPEGVIGGTHHQKHRRRRIDPVAARQVVLREGPNLHRLRRDAEWCRRECSDRFERFRLRAAGCQQAHAPGAVALPRHGRGTASTADPLDANPLHAKIVPRHKTEPHRFGFQEHGPARQAVDGDRRRLVVTGRHAHDERLATGEPQAVLPCDRDIA